MLQRPQSTTIAPGATWYGFDSFEGLPEAWTLGAKAGAFSIGGHLPPVRSNVRLTKGFFEDTLPGFVAQHPGAKIALLHIDCDFYDPVKLCLQTFYDLVTPGGYIVIDDYGSYAGCRKAVDEFLRAVVNRRVVESRSQSAIRNPFVRVERCALRHIAIDFRLQIRHAD